MPDACDDFGRHHIVRQDVRRIKVAAAPVRVEESARVHVPPYVPNVLVRVVEGVVPATRTQLVEILGIAEGSPYPAQCKKPGRVDTAWAGALNTAHADVEGMLTHIAVYRLDLFRLAILLDTYRAAPPLAGFFQISYRVFAYSIDCFSHKCRIA